MKRNNLTQLLYITIATILILITKCFEDTKTDNIKKTEINRLLKDKSDDCATPIDCYTNAINALNLAKQTYYSAVDKLESIQKTLISYMDEKINNSTIDLKTYNENIRSELENKINSNQEYTISRFNDVIWSQHNHSCRDVNTNCQTDGNGNFVYTDRHYVACADNEFMKSWHWERCDSSNIRVHFTCCRNP